MNLRNLLLVTISIATSMILAILFVAEIWRSEEINYA